MIRSLIPRIFALVGGLIVFLVCSNASAGKLRDFEKAASGQDTSRSSSSSSNNSSNSSSNGSSNNDRSRSNSRNDYYYDPYYDRHHRRPIHRRRYCRRSSLFDDIFFPHHHHDRCHIHRRTTETVIIHSEDSTAQTIQESEPESEILPLESLRTSRMLEPSIRLDFAIGELDSTLELQDIKMEGGYKMISLVFQRSDIVEDYIEDGISYRDEIKIDKVLLNYRLRIDDNFAVEIGIGSYDLGGIFDFSESAVRFGGKWHDPSGFGLEYHLTSVLGDDLEIEEDELTLFYGYDNFSLRLGYRNLSASKAFNMSIGGAFMGFTASF